MDGKLFLIDGHSLIFRMYYAFLRHPMVNSKREDVSILYGFTRYLLELTAKYAPTHMAVCFDPPGKTFRHQLYPQYKGTRQATPEQVIAALDPLLEICGAMELPVLMVPGFEGDDVLGSMAVRSAAEGLDVYMVTPDKDFGQLISDKIIQLKPGKGGGDDEMVGPAQLCARYGINSPGQVIDMLAICGDSADNVPGVTGVGEVGAAKLIGKYGSVGNIYAHLDELPSRQQELFRAAQDHIDLSRTLVTIKTDIPLETTADEMLLSGTYGNEVARLFDRFEFPSLRKMISIRRDGEGALPAPDGTTSAPPAPDGTTSALPAPDGTALPVLDDVAPDVLYKFAKQAGIVGIATDADSDGGLLRLTLAAPSVKGFVTCSGSPEIFSGVLVDGSVVKTGYDLKDLLGQLGTCNIVMSGRLDDTALLHYLVNPEQSHKVDVLSRSYLGINPDRQDGSLPDRAPEILPGLFDDAPNEGGVSLKDRRLEAAVLVMLDEKLRSDLREMRMENLFDTVEEPLQRVLSRMETNGVKVDMAPLRSYAGILKEEMVAIENKVRAELEDADLNLSSPRQIGIALFEKKKIDPKRKPDPKHVYPTDEETLMNYAESFPVIYDILEYRGIKKLIGTYIEPFDGWISPSDGRIHTTFNQTQTATGRLSSSRPNLQNIPIRTERGREIRKAFVAGDADHVIVSADYSQIELRLMAHFCADAHMIEAFSKNLDVHAITASKIFHVPLEEVTPDMRRAAKTANFGIMYGISAFGLAQRLKMPRVAAKKLIEDYFSSFPSIRGWIDSTTASASENGYVQTLFARRRYLPDINSRNATVRSLAARNAVNAPIQGTAADIMKIAMIAVDRRIRQEKMSSKMVLQIHDELVFDAPRCEVEKLMEILKQEMEHVIELSVPLTIECNYGDNWLEAH